MQSRTDQFTILPIRNILEGSSFSDSDQNDVRPSPPPTGNLFLLLNSNNFQLLNGNNLALL